MLFCGACKNLGKNEDKVYIARLSEINEADVYFDYRVSATEGDDNLTIMIRYYEGYEEGPTVLIDSPAHVALDSTVLRVDSTGLSGAFYEIQKPISSFSGEHTITLITAKNKYEERFLFEPLTLVSPLPDTIGRDDLVLQLGGLETEDFVRTVITDTVITHDGINRIDTVQNGLLRLNRTDLETLTSGPVHIEIHREFERPVRNSPDAGGRIFIGYILKKDIYLKN